MVLLPIGQLHPHPDNPRKNLGDLAELAESIRANGIFQNLTVVPREDGYTVIIGHRRRAAAELAGLQELPCVIVDMSAREQLQTMLLENMQRVDLTVYEQAQGFQMMLDLGESVEGIAEKTGFSKKTVQRRLEMAKLDQATLKEVSCRQITMEDFDRLAKLDSMADRNKALKSIGTNNFDSEVAMALKRQNIKKNLPAAKRLIKGLGAKVLPAGKRYSGEYERPVSIRLENWSGSCPKEVEGKTDLFYDLDERWGSLDFYRKKKKAAPQKKSREQLDREKAIAEAHAQVRQLTKLHYELRRAFVEKLTVGPKNREALLRAAVLCGAIESCCYAPTDTDAIKNLLGVPTGYIADREKKMAEAFAKLPESEYPKLVYAMLKDGETMGYATTYKEQMPSHHDNGPLDAIYTWLCWMGYEMSDDEIAMQRGTHALLQVK